MSERRRRPWWGAVMRVGSGGGGRAVAWRGCFCGGGGGWGVPCDRDGCRAGGGGRGGWNRPGRRWWAEGGGPIFLLLQASRLRASRREGGAKAFWGLDTRRVCTATRTCAGTDGCQRERGIPASPEWDACCVRVESTRFALAPAQPDFPRSPFPPPRLSRSGTQPG